MKKEDYKDKILSIMNATCSYQSYQRARATENFDYYYGKFVNESYDQLLALHESKEENTEGNTPFVKINYNQIHTKTEYLLGEFISRGFEPVASATNKEAFERREQIKRKMKILARLQPMFRQAAEFTGIDYGITNQLPKNDDELEAFMDQYVDVHEELIGEALRVGIDRYGYAKDERIKLFLDYVLQGHVHCKVENINGFERPRRINPKQAGPDWSTESNFFDDGVHFFEWYYIPISQAIEQFDLDEKTVKEMIKAFEANEKNMWTGFQYQKDGQSLKAMLPFENRRGGWNGMDYDRILVVEAEWKYVKKKKQKTAYDEHGNLHVHEYDRDYKTGLSKKERKLGAELKNGYKECVKYGVLIGGGDLVEYGETGSYIRDVDNPAITKMRYVSAVHNYNDQDFVSMVDRVKVLQDFRNYVMTLMQKEITTNIGGVVAIDTAKIDEDIYGTGKQATENVLHYAKAFSVVYYNSEKGQKAPGPNSIPIQQVEVKSRTVIQECVNVAAQLEAEINNITGISDARQGNVGERALVKTTQMSMAQSSKMTASLFESFNNFEEKLLERWVEALAVQWANEPEKYQEIAARLHIDLPEDYDPDMQKWYVEIKNYPLSKEELREAAQLSVKQGNLTADEYLEIMTIAAEKNFMTGVRKYLKTVERRRQQMQEARQAEMEAERRAQAEREARQDQSILQREKMKTETERYKTDRSAESQERNKDLEVNQRDREAVSERMQNE